MVKKLLPFNVKTSESNNEMINEMNINHPDKKQEDEQIELKQMKPPLLLTDLKKELEEWEHSRFLNLITHYISNKIHETY